VTLTLKTLLKLHSSHSIKRTRANRRGGGEVHSISPFVVLSEGDEHSPLQQAILNDCYEYYLNALPEKLRALAELHLAGFTNGEIANQMNCVERTVERKIALLRMRWQTFAAESVHQDLDTLTGNSDH
jgi:DNA-directed RNA polymerase specialized sigma24 family protein